MKLILMTDFILQFDKPVGYYENESDFLHCQVEYMSKVMKYAKFLKQPLKLEMFVPCDLEGNVLKEPACDCKTEYDREGCSEQCFEYKNAKNKVLFEEVVINNIQPSTAFNFITLNGVSIANQSNDGKYYIKPSLRTIEKLQFLLGDIELTESAIKQLGL